MASSSTGAPFDLMKVIRQVHFSYRAEPDGSFSAGHPTYRVQAQATGFSFTPVHHPPAADKAHALTPVEGDAAHFGAARLSRGATPIDDGALRARVEQDGSLAWESRAYAETLRNGEEGVEQAWRFPQAPPGRGDLVVRVPVQGMKLTAATDTGLHFADARTGLGLRYGHATWVDAAGRRTGLRAAWESGEVVLRVPGELLAASSYPAVLDPVISPEVGIDAPVFGPARASQEWPAVAFDGSNYLVVWQDRRGANLDIYGARVRPDGTVLDPTGLVISSASGDQTTPAVASLGGQFLVVWSDTRNGNPDIYGARVRADGSVLDPSGMGYSVTTGSQSSPDLASDGSQYLLVWEDDRSGAGFDIYGARLSATGFPQGSTLVLASAINGQQAPSVASSGTDFLVVWQDGRASTASGTGDIYGTRVSSGGTVVDPAGLAISTATNLQGQPDVVSTGQGYLVVWSDYRNGASDIYGARVGSDGAVLDAAGRAIASYSGAQDRPTVAFNGTQSLVTWADARTGSGDIYGNWVDTAGTVPNTSGFALSGATNGQSSPAVASDGSGFLVTWADTRNAVGSSYTSDIYATRVLADGTVADAEGVPVALMANLQRAPAVAFNGSHYLVVWQDMRDGVTDDIYGVRVRADGTVLDPAGFALATGAIDQREPAVASSGSDFLVVWSDQRAGAWDITGARVSADGAVLDPWGLQVSRASNDQKHPAVASNGNGYLVVWWDSRSNYYGDVYAARVSTSGAVLDANGLAVQTVGASPLAPAVASDGADYLAVWGEQRSGGSDIYGRRVKADGTLPDGAALALATAAGDQAFPAVASTGTDYLVAWEAAAGTETDIVGTRVATDGTVVDAAGLVLCQAQGRQVSVSLSASAHHYVASWLDSRGGTTDVYATRLRADGTRLDGDGFAVTTGVASTSRPVVALGAGEHALVVYEVSSTLRARLASLAEPPVATPKSVQVEEDGAVEVVLSGTDAEGDALTYVITGAPQHGELLGTPPSVTYRPAPNFNGEDSFTFTASDATATSEAATVHVTVTPVNDAPVAHAGTLTVKTGESAALTLVGTDVDGDALTYTVVSPPAHGLLTGSAPQLSYAPAGDYWGADQLTFTVSDGRLTSAPQTVSITIQPSGNVGGGGGGGTGGTRGGCSTTGPGTVMPLAMLLAVLGMRRRRA